VILPDGERLVYPASIEATAEEIGRISPADKEGFLKYCAKFEEFLSGGGLDFFVSPMNSMADMMSAFIKIPVLMKFAPFFAMTYDDVIKKYFKDERIRQSMAYQSFYCGHSPEQAVGIFGIIPYSEHKGIFFPRGGMIQIPLALQRLGEKFGMQLRLNSEVKKVLVNSARKAQGVVLKDGTAITADIVISNINARKLYLDMVGEEHLAPIVRRGIRSYNLSKSTPYICLGLDYEPPLDAHHTLYTKPIDFMNEFWWEKYRVGIAPKPEEQFGLICWPTRADPSLAPKGHHIIALDFQGPYNLKDADWDTFKEDFSEDLINYLSQNVIPGLKDHIKTMVISTPKDFERRLLNPGGAFYCFQQDISAQTVFRPAAKSKSIKSLYLTGASTHPGGGVPTVMASGIVAANLIEKYER
jgi:phytoene desaturase